MADQSILCLPRYVLFFFICNCWNFNNSIPSLKKKKKNRKKKYHCARIRMLQYVTKKINFLWQSFDISRADNLIFLLVQFNPIALRTAKTMEFLVSHFSKCSLHISHDIVRLSHFSCYSWDDSHHTVGTVLVLHLSLDLSHYTAELGPMISTRYKLLGWDISDDRLCKFNQTPSIPSGDRVQTSYFPTF